MPRPKRIAIEGLIYHVINRGNNRQVVFKDSEDFEVFLMTIKKFKEKYRFKLYGYCLMNNHIHLVMEPTVKGTLSKIIQSITLSHIRLYHKKYRTSGHLWQGRFKNPVIEADEYLLECLRYVELNPVKVGVAKAPGAYSYSSFGFHVYGEDKYKILDQDPVYMSLGRTDKDRQAAYRKLFATEQDEQIIQAIRKSIESGFALATDGFLGQLREKLSLFKPRSRGRPRLR